MSSRCVLANSRLAGFGVRRVVSGNINSYDLCDVIGNEFPNAYAFRPIITLNSNVQIDTANSGDGSTAQKAYAIK